jgi:precorrin-6Y C5,15-methyltransferase (decarboxylating)
VIVVIGIGADGMAGLSAEARSEVHRATVIHGTRRQLDLLDAGVSAARREWPSPMLPAVRALLDGEPGDVHVLASGDPMLHGIGGTLVRLFGPLRVKVFPHVSSVTLACARMGWTTQDTEVISLVNAQPHTAVRRGGRAIVLSRDGDTPQTLARLLAEQGLGESEFTVLEQLGGPAERRLDATAGQWAAHPAVVAALHVIAVRFLPAAVRSSAPGLPDDEFAHDGQITKQTIRALTVSALAPRPGELLWDVGSGSGSIAVEWARSAPGCSAVAFERDERRRRTITENAEAFGVGIDVRADAPLAFDGVDPPAAMFIGGGFTQPGLPDACIDRLPVGGRLVVNVVTAESEATLVQWYSQMGGELRRFQHHHGEPLGGFTGWRPQLPVTQWVVTKR